MDKFFDNFYSYKGFGPAFAKREVPQEKIERFRGKLPDQLLEYWKEYGWCGYAQGLFWTVDPDEWEPALEAWIGDTELMEQDAYYVIARTAFGELILWGEKSGPSLKILSTYAMIFPADCTEEMIRRSPDRMVQSFFSSKSRDSMDMQDENEKPLFARALKKLGPLDHDTMYGFVPALALGGPVRLENLQKLDAIVHLDILSGLGERQLMADIGKISREN